MANSDNYVITVKFGGLDSSAAQIADQIQSQLDKEVSPKLRVKARLDIADFESQLAKIKQSLSELGKTQMIRVDMGDQVLNDIDKQLGTRLGTRIVSEVKSAFNEISILAKQVGGEVSTALNGIEVKTPGGLSSATLSQNLKTYKNYIEEVKNLAIQQTKALSEAYSNIDDAAGMSKRVNKLNQKGADGATGIENVQKMIQKLAVFLNKDQNKLKLHIEPTRLDVTELQNQIKEWIKTINNSIKNDKIKITVEYDEVIKNVGDNQQIADNVKKAAKSRGSSGGSKTKSSSGGDNPNYPKIIQILQAILLNVTAIRDKGTASTSGGKASGGTNKGAKRSKTSVGNDAVDTAAQKNINAAVAAKQRERDIDEEIYKLQNKIVVTQDDQVDKSRKLVELMHERKTVTDKFNDLSRNKIPESDYTKLDNAISTVDNSDLSQKLDQSIYDSNLASLSKLTHKAEEAEKRIAKVNSDLRNINSKAIPQDYTDDGKKLIEIYNGVSKRIADFRAQTDTTQRNKAIKDIQQDLLTAAQIETKLDAQTKQLKANLSTPFKNAFEASLNKTGNKLTTYFDSHSVAIRRNKQLYSEYLSLFTRYKSGDFKSVAEMTSALTEFQIHCRDAGVEVDGFFNKLIKQTAKNLRSSLASTGIMLIQNGLRQIYQNVLQIDTAMTELKKVTDATEQEYTQFLDNASTRAKELGVTLEAVVNASADFARLGYTISQASQLADTALIYSNVGDDVESIDQASKSIISTMQAFDVQADNSMSIVDKFNEVSNNYATSAGDIGEGLQRSAAALSAANNSIDESVALFTSAQTTVQDADVVGTALKTLAMRLRSSKSDLENAGEDTDGMANSVSKLRDELLSLSGIDIMIDDNTFKSTYQILDEMSKVWGNINDVSQANILELMFGKRQANVGTAILQNSDILEQALQTSQQSSGSALKENDVFLQSIQGHLNKLAATWQSFSNDALDSDLVKTALSGLNGLLSVVDALAKVLTSLPIIAGVAGMALALMGKKAASSFAELDNFSSQSVSKSLQDKLAAYNKAVDNGDAGTASNLKAEIDAENASLIKMNDSLRERNKLLTFNADGTISDESKKMLQNPYNKGTMSANLYDKSTNKLREANSSILALENSTSKFQIKQRANIAVTKLQAAGYKGLAAAVNVGTKALNLCKSALSGIAIGAAITVITTGVQALAHSLDFVAQADDAIAALKDTRSEIENINSELDSTQQKIADLKAQGNLSITSQNELKNLKEQNTFLEKKLSIAKALEKSQVKTASDKSMTALDGGTWYEKLLTGGPQSLYKIINSFNARKNFAVENGTDITPEFNGSTYADQIAQYQAKLKSLKNDLNNASGEDIDSIKDGIDKAGSKLAGLMDKATGYLSNVDYESLNDEQKKMYDYYQRMVNQYTLDNGGDLQSIFSSYGNEIDNLDEKLRKWDDGSKSDTMSDKTAIPGLPKDFISKCQEYGISIDSLRQHIKSLREDETVVASDNSFADAISSLGDAEDTVSTLSSAVGELNTSGALSLDSLKKISETFKDMDPTKLNGILSALADPNSSIKEKKDAINDLASAYLSSSNVLNSLTDENKDYYAAQLKAMGVANASTVVEIALAKARYLNAKANSQEKAEAKAHLTTLLMQQGTTLGVANATTYAANCIAALNAVQKMNDGASFQSVMLKNGAAILSVAKASGVACKELVNYNKTLQEINKIHEAQAAIGTLSKGKNEDESTYQQRKLMAYRGLGYQMQSAQIKLSKLSSKANTQFDDVITSIYGFAGTNITAPTDSSSGSKSGSKSSKDPYEKAKKKLDYQLKMNLISYETYYKKLKALGKKYLKGKKGKGDDYRTHLEDLSSTREDAFNHYKDKLDDLLEKGSISIATYFKRYTAYQKQWLTKSKSNAEAYAESNKTLDEQVLKYWEDQVSKTDDYISRRNMLHDWAPGENELTLWQKQLEKIKASYVSGIISATNYNKLFYELLGKIEDAQNEVGDNMDSLVDMVSNLLKQEQKDMIDALEDQKDAYDDIIDQKKKSLDLTKSELSYQREIESSNKEITDLQAEASLYALDNTREGQAKYKELLKEIEEKQKDLAERQEDHSYEATTDALDKAKEEFDEKTQDKIDILNDQMDNAGEWLQRVYDEISKRGGDLLEQLVAYNFKYGDGIDKTVKNMWETAGPLLQSYSYDIKAILEKLNAQGDSNKNDSSNYMSRSDLIAQLSSTKSKGRSDSANLDYAGNVYRYFGDDATYDASSNVWYSDAAKKISVEAYDLIANIKKEAKSNNSASAKKKSIKSMMSQLVGMSGYSNAHFDYKNWHLYKTKGTGTKIFHEGLAGGFVGESYTPSQKETYALLRNDELVLNKADQLKLGQQLTILAGIKDVFRDLDLGVQSSYGAVTNNTGGITINVTSPITINGNADSRTVAQLNQVADTIANQTLNKLQSAMGQRGYNTRAGSNAFKK